MDFKTAIEVTGNELGRLIELFEKDIDEDEAMTSYLVTAQQTTEMLLQLEEYAAALRELKACRDRIFWFLGLK